MIKLGDFLSLTDTTPGSPSVWIADDLTVVTSRAQCKSVVKYITTEGPMYGLRPSHGKLEAYSPYITTNHPLALTLAENGFIDTSKGPAGVPHVSASGLHRLLGAVRYPILCQERIGPIGISASPTACPSRGCGRAGTQNI